jgi:hypothetical protein
MTFVLYGYFILIFFSRSTAHYRSYLTDDTDTHILWQAALGRTSALLAAQKEPKPTPEKKVRGKGAHAAQESA